MECYILKVSGVGVGDYYSLQPPPAQDGSPSSVGSSAGSRQPREQEETGENWLLVGPSGVWKPPCSVHWVHHGVPGDFPALRSHTQSSVFKLGSYSLPHPTLLRNLV